MFDGSAESFQIINHVDRPIEQIYELHFQPNLEVGTYSLELQFKGDIRDDLTGLYDSTYYRLTYDAGSQWR